MLAPCLQTVIAKALAIDVAQWYQHAADFYVYIYIYIYIFATQTHFRQTNPTKHCSDLPYTTQRQCAACVPRVTNGIWIIQNVLWKHLEINLKAL